MSSSQPSAPPQEIDVSPQPLGCGNQEVNPVTKNFYKEGCDNRLHHEPWRLTIQTICPKDCAVAQQRICNICKLTQCQNGGCYTVYKVNGVELPGFSMRDRHDGESEEDYKRNVFSVYRAEEKSTGFASLLWGDGQICNATNRRGHSIIPHDSALYLCKKCKDFEASQPCQDCSLGFCSKCNSYRVVDCDQHRLPASTPPADQEAHLQYIHSMSRGPSRQASRQSTVAPHSPGEGPATPRAPSEQPAARTSRQSTAEPNSPSSTEQLTPRAGSPAGVPRRGLRGGSVAPSGSIIAADEEDNSARYARARTCPPGN
ncbi:hypothetical protein BJ508DRAFT_300523 [Ascobolus immersus RN42]|uniref:Uncharacterized protein n=1 Tax=Ascobolus immersus RN42 TaxID=1160509 RepID=A0A3N4IQT8_ASCIM|nr:hypothetical protein BJ508DRAFT_300523 [Ascobolus immersus RN42]